MSPRPLESGGPDDQGHGTRAKSPKTLARPLGEKCFTEQGQPEPIGLFHRIGITVVIAVISGQQGRRWIESHDHILFWRRRGGHRKPPNGDVSRSIVAASSDNIVAHHRK